MKKSGLIPHRPIAILLGLCLVFGFAFGGATAFAAADDYSVTQFSSLPADWELSPLCDTANVTTTYSGGNMVIKSTSTKNQESYYGALYRIATNKSYADFTFEMSFKMTDPADASRWMGVMYHTKLSGNGNNLSGYLVNYRSSGASAASVVSTATPPVFADEAQVNVGVPLSDNKFHTLTVTMSGNTATHYIDGLQITQWDVSIKNSYLGGSPYTEGGFALIVNRSTVTVESVKITSAVVPPSQSGAERDTTLATTYKTETDLVSEPTVVCDVADESTLGNVVASVEEADAPRPSNAILRFNEDCNVVGAKGENLGSFLEIYKKLDHKIIPIVYVSDKPSADAFVDFMENTLYILDIAVMSDNASLVKSVRDAEPAIRGIVEYKEEPDKLYDMVKQSTESQAMVVALSQELATVETVNYLQARFKTVWVRADSEDHGDYLDCITSGAFGVICKDFDYAYYSMGMITGYTRNIFNVAHRALPNIYNENGLLGIEAAMRTGVTHLELDGHLTKDKRIVIIHDDTIDSMTNGSGTIENMTYAEIQQYDLDVREPHEKVPTFEEVIELINRLNEELGTDVVLVFEIKDDQRDFVQYMKEILDRYDFYEHIVIITFDNAEQQLDTLKATVPQIPTATLDLATLGGNMAALNGKNTGIDHIYTDTYYNTNNDILRDRGYIGWYWTFGDANGVNNASKNGVVGVTNNAADCFKDNIRYIYGTTVTDATEENVPEVGDAITLHAVLYSGDVMTIYGKVYYTDTKDGNWRCFASYTDYECGYARTVYTQGILYIPPVPETDDDPAFPWWIPVVAVVGALAIGGAVAATVIILRKKKKV